MAQPNFLETPALLELRRNSVFSSVVSMFLCLGLIGGAEAQAEALFSFVTEPKVTMYKWRTVIDDSGYVWVLNNWDHALFASRISPEGERVLDQIPLMPPPDGPISQELGRVILPDRWCNVYFSYYIDNNIEIGPSYLGQITSSGEVHHYRTWFEDVDIRFPHMEILLGDTLMIIGKMGHVDNQIVKASMQPGELSLISSELVPRSKSLTIIRNHGYYVDSYSDWERGWGFIASLFGGNNPDLIFQELSYGTLDLKPADGYSVGEKTTILWEDYVWKTYPDVFTGQLAIIPYRGGGYSLLIPDFIDSNTTHILRLNEEGIPINPSGLEGGGTLNPRPYDSLPSGFQPHVYFHDWVKYRVLSPDSAMVVFWGCDDEGNLYATTFYKRFFGED